MMTIIARVLRILSNHSSKNRRLPFIYIYIYERAWKIEAKMKRLGGAIKAWRKKKMLPSMRKKIHKKDVQILVYYKCFLFYR